MKSEYRVRLPWGALLFPPVQYPLGVGARLETGGIGHGERQEAPAWNLG